MKLDLLRLALLATPLVVACATTEDEAVDDEETDTDGETDETDDTEPAPTASVRVVHASANVPAVSLWAGGEALITSLAYGEASDFADVPAGTLAVDLCAAGVSSCPTPIGSVELDLDEDTTYTVIAAGDGTSSDAADAFRLLILPHSFTAPTTGNSVVRIVHASPDAPTVGLDLGADDSEDPEVASFPRWGESGAPGVQVPGGDVVRIGVTPENGGTALTTFTPPALGDGNEWFVIATGFAGAKSYWSTGFTLLAVNQDGDTAFIRQDPRVFTLHGSLDAPAVDVFVGDSELISDLAYGDLEGVRVPPGTYDVDLFGADNESTTRPEGSPAFTLADLELEAGQEYLAVASGYFNLKAADTAFNLFATQLAFDPTDLDKAQVQITHNSPDTPAVDIGTYDTTTCEIEAIASDLEYGDSSEILALDEDTYDLGAASAGETYALGYFPALAVAAGDQLVAVVHGYGYFGGLAKAVAPSASLQVSIIDTSGVLSTPWTSSAVYVSYPSCSFAVGE